MALCASLLQQQMAAYIPTYLLSPAKTAALKFTNRIALAPLTRARGDGRIASKLAQEYYAQRAAGGFGLLISEATAISAQGYGWGNAPGLYTPEMTAAWGKCVEAAKAANPDVVFFAQLWHMGRQSHSSFQEGGALPVAPSAIAVKGEKHTADGSKSMYEVPRALETAEIKDVVAAYGAAAANAKEAGFDGVEIHAANGYLLDCFLQSSTNLRTDAYGGSKENRYRILGEVVEAVKAVYEPGRIAVRFSPNGVFGDMGSADNAEAFPYYASKLAEAGVGILHVMDGLGFGGHPHEKVNLFQMKTAFKGGFVIGNVGFTKESADGAVRSGAADMVAFGRPSMTNPDLPRKFEKGEELAPSLDYKYWYVPGAAGYTEAPPA